MDQHTLNQPLSSDTRLLLKHIEDLAQIGIWELHLETKEIAWSQGVFNMLGYDPQTFEVNLSTAASVIHPEDQKRASALFDDALTKGQPYTIQKRLIAKDGSIKHILSKATITKDASDRPIKVLGVFQDITKSVEAQLASSKQEDRLKAIIRSEPDCVKVMSPESTLLDMNPAGLKMIESTLPLSDLLNKKLDHLIHPDDQEICKTLHEQALAGQDGKVCFRLIGMQGTERYVECKSVPLKNEKNEIYAVLSLTRDITEKMQLEEEIAHSEKRFRALVENSADAFAIIGADGSPTYVSPSITHVLGYSEQEAVQLNLFDLVHPHDAEAVGGRMAEAMQNPGVPTQGHVSRVLHKDGSWRWLDATITNLFGDPVINGIVDNFRDVTEAKELQTLLDNASQLAQVGGWEMNLLNKTYHWSPVTCDIYEVEHNVKPTFEAVLNFYEEEHRDLAKQYIDLIINENKDFDFEALITTAKGDSRWIRTIGRSESINGKRIRIFGSVQDIHDRKILKLELEQKIQELAVSNEELEQFAYIASHDLQEPLRMINSFLGLLEKRYTHQLDQKAKQYIHFATDGARRMRQVILALLDFSRVGKVQDKLSVFSLAEAIEETLTLKSQLIQEKNAVIEYANLPSLKSYRAPVQQILQNLIENALKYSKEDQSPVIRVQAVEHPTEWEITVQDNGIGISPEYHHKIFTIFQRLHLRHEYSGTGVGLAIVKKIVESLGGKVWVNSAEGTGSTFYFTLKKKPSTHVRFPEYQSIQTSI